MESLQVDEQKMLAKVKLIFNKLNENKKLQDLAIDNGLDIRNKVELTDSAMENIIISIISMLLAKECGDPEYDDVVRKGLEHRSGKVNLINKRKNQAIQLFTRYKKELQQ